MDKHHYSVLLATEKSFQESEMAHRLSQDCSVVLSKDRSRIADEIKLRAIPFSAFIIDTTSVDEDTIKLINTIRELDPVKNTPVILIVDDISDDLIDQGFNAGATDVIVRPYSVYAHRRVLNYIELHETSMEHQRSMRELDQARKDLDTILTCTPGGLFRYIASTVPGEDVFDYISPGLAQMMGCKDDEEFRAYTGNCFRGFVHPDDRESVLESIEIQARATGSDKVTYRIIRKDGEVRWIEDWGNLIMDSNGVEWYYVVVLDITEKIEDNESLKILAEHDSLTGIYNREGAFSMVKKKRGEKDTACSLLLIDIDDFKGINDTYGHPFGDEVLKHLATFLDTVLREGDIVSRLGGDEFAAFIIGLGDSERLRYLVKRISESAFEDFDSTQFIDEKVTPTVSIGVSFTDHSDTEIDELYALSDEALYETKRQGKNGYSFYGDNRDSDVKSAQSDGQVKSDGREK